MLISEAILTLDDASLPAENWEGVAVARYGEQTLVALISDDHESVSQRSRLLLFAWRG